jgi:hypothetical protein
MERLGGVGLAHRARAAAPAALPARAARDCRKALHLCGVICGAVSSPAR